LPVALGLSVLFGSLGIAKTARGFIISALLTEAPP
jgi:TM2 domain-containing membrane protein YozV